MRESESVPVVSDDGDIEADSKSKGVTFGVEGYSSIFDLFNGWED